MEHDLRNTVALLRRTPASLDALLRGLPGYWIGVDEGAGTWTVADVIAHLIYGEHVDWIPRMRMILEFGETRTFEPFNRQGNIQESRGKPLGELLDEFAAVRVQNLSVLEALNLTPQQLERRGRHPALGPVSLSQLLAAWAAHDLTHLHQISRILAHQYRVSVGPFDAFLGVMQCAGHSAP
jgi:hypothetical protein